MQENHSRNCSCSAPPIYKVCYAIICEILLMAFFNQVKWFFRAIRYIFYAVIAFLALILPIKYLEEDSILKTYFEMILATLVIAVFGQMIIYPFYLSALEKAHKEVSTTNFFVSLQSTSQKRENIRLNGHNCMKAGKMSPISPLSNQNSGFSSYLHREMAQNTLIQQKIASKQAKITNSYRISLALVYLISVFITVFAAVGRSSCWFPESCGSV